MAQMAGKSGHSRGNPVALLTRVSIESVVDEVQDVLAGCSRNERDWKGATVFGEPEGTLFVGIWTEDSIARSSRFAKWSRIKNLTPMVGLERNPPRRKAVGSTHYRYTYKEGTGPRVRSGLTLANRRSRCSPPFVLPSVNVRSRSYSQIPSLSDYP